jgi:hypothetical protein
MHGEVVVPAEKMPAMNNGHPLWDASDGSEFYYTAGNELFRATITTKAAKGAVLHPFKEYKSIVSPDAADMSQDGDHIALVGENADHTMDIFVWALREQVKTAVYRTNCKAPGRAADSPQPGCLHKMQLTADNQLSLQFATDGAAPEQGLRLWDGHGLVALQNTTNHYDTGYDLSDASIYVAADNSATLPSFVNPCSSGWGLDVRQLQALANSKCLLDHQPSWHVSYRGGKSQPWVALSFFDDRKAGPELFAGDGGYQPPSLRNWALYEGEIALARIDGSAMYRLAHARSRSAVNFWSSPRAAISRDGKYVVFTSNMAHAAGCPAHMHVAGNCTDVYVINVR